MSVISGYMPNLPWNGLLDHGHVFTSLTNEGSSNPMVQSEQASPSQTNVPMTRGRQISLPFRNSNMINHGNRGNWWKNATEQQQTKYSDIQATGTCQTPDWHTRVNYHKLTPEGNDIAMNEFTIVWPHMDSKLWDSTTCEVCGDAGPLFYRACNKCSCGPAWYDGRCCKGDLTFQKGERLSRYRGFAHTPGTTSHRPVGHAPIFKASLTVETPNGTFEPLKSNRKHVQSNIGPAS